MTLAQCTEHKKNGFQEVFGFISLNRGVKMTYCSNMCFSFLTLFLNEMLFSNSSHFFFTWEKCSCWPWAPSVKLFLAHWISPVNTPCPADVLCPALSRRMLYIPVKTSRSLHNGCFLLVLLLDLLALQQTALHVLESIKWTKKGYLWLSKGGLQLT